MKKILLYGGGGFFAFIIILGIILAPSKEERAAAAKAASEQAAKDSLKLETERTQAKAQKEAEDLAFSKLPKKEQQRIIKEREEAAAEAQKASDMQAMKKILENGDTNFHLKYISEKAIEANLKVPDSYDKEEISEPEIRSVDGKNFFVVIVKYKAQNAFGVKIRESKNVIINSAGTQVVSILDTK